MDALPVACPVLTTEPAGFWDAQRFGKWIERGTPTIAASDLTFHEVDLAEFVLFELQEGARAYDERRQRSNEAFARLTAHLPTE
jgi:hypothetical protein